MTTRDGAPILAAGCVLWRPAVSGHGIELALIHRPKWADWSHPKGKLKHGEGAREAAVREVREETGMTCELGSELPTIRYQVQGRAKEVRYWAARATSGSFEPNREVDRLIWLSPSAAQKRLTQQEDKVLVADLVKMHPARGGEGP
ncbi:NUDIX hydrolase [Streptomyces sp. NPDC055103]